MTSLRRLFLAPGAAVLLVTLAAPLAIVCAYSVLSRGAYGGVEPPYTVENYTLLFTPLYTRIFVRSFAMAMAATVLCVVLGFPLALFIARSRRRALYLGLVILPFWSSFLIRMYAWIFLLRDTGLINTVLQRLHITAAPLPMLYNNGAVLLGLVYGYLPFAVLPLYAVVERVARQDRALLEAAADLGASPGAVFWKVMAPLCLPGIRAAALLVFVPCLGTYLVSDLLGGSKTVLIGNVIQNQFTASRDWPFGAALSMVMVLAMLALLSGARRGGEELV